MTDRISKSDIAVFVELAHEDADFLPTLRSSGISNTVVKEMSEDAYFGRIYEAKDVSLSSGSSVPNSMTVGLKGNLAVNKDKIGCVQVYPSVFLLWNSRGHWLGTHSGLFRRKW